MINAIIFIYHLLKIKKLNTVLIITDNYKH